MNTTYTKKQFLEDVAKEAKALKEHATPEELANLNLDRLLPQSYSECIYGQMTGNCNSERAVDLIEACCPRYFHNAVDELGNSPAPQSVIKRKVNGSKVDGFRAHRYKARKEIYTTLRYLSVIETYIVAPFAKNKNLIAFLKGERKDLVL